MLRTFPKRLITKLASHNASDHASDPKGHLDEADLHGIISVRMTDEIQSAIDLLFWLSWTDLDNVLLVVYRMVYCAANKMPVTDYRYNFSICHAPLSFGLLLTGDDQNGSVARHPYDPPDYRNGIDVLDLH